MFEGYGDYLIIFGVFMLLSWFVSNRLKTKFAQYSKEPLSSGMTGKQVAEKMLHDNGINDVTVMSTPGQLTDHYNPTNKTVNLSESVYNTCSVAAAAVAAHECGHAVQHATAYKWLTMRSKLVPIVSIGSNLSQWVLYAGMFMLAIQSLLNLGLWVIGIGLAMFGLTTLFSFITLPVEYNASNRALQWLDKTGITKGTEHDDAKDALRWAARTYVVAALSSLATLLYYVYIFFGRRD